MKGKHSTGKKERKLVLVATGVVALLLLGVVGTAAAVGVASDPNERIPGGFQVGGVDLEGLDVSTARDHLKEAFESPLDAPIEVLVDGRSVKSVSRRDLGASTNVEEVFSEAIAGFGEMSVFERFRQRLTGKPTGNEFEVETDIDEAAVGKFVEQLAEEVKVPAEDAAVALAGNSVRVAPGAEGFELDRDEALKSVSAAVKDPSVRKIDLSGSAVAPGKTAADFENVIVVKVGENTLQHFRSGKLVKTYDVATGLASYPTPIGEFEIVLKRYRPTWINPAKSPGRWGENLPARIGPGPNNPLGTRAMNLNSPNIRIHGTSSDWSLGYNASHGCIRMSIKDSEELFDRVEEGTKVIIVRSGPDRPAPARNSEPTVEDLVESDGAAAQGPAAPEESEEETQNQQELQNQQEPQPTPSPDDPGTDDQPELNAPSEEEQDPDVAEELTARFDMDGV